MSVLYIKSMGTELEECQKENELLKAIIESQKVKIEKQNIMIDHIADLMSKGCSLIGTKKQIIKEMEREAMNQWKKI